MYQREIFRISPTPSPRTYVYTEPYETSVSYHYPCQILVRNDLRNDFLLSDTQAIRRDLTQIRSDIGEIKRRQPSPTYYTVQQDYPIGFCSICNASISNYHQKQYLHNSVYYCDRCQQFFEERAYSVGPRVRTKLPNTTYQDSYTPPPPCSSPGAHMGRPITLNELRGQHPWSPVTVQHTRHWVPGGYKNTYPSRRWNLSVPHPEP